MKCPLVQWSFAWRFLDVLIAGAVALVLSQQTAAQSTQASFQGLGLIPGANQSVAYGVSDNGEVVVGAKNEELGVAFRWTAQGGLTVLPLGGQGSGRADEVSGNGQVTVGQSTVQGVGGCTWNGNALGITFGSTASPIAASADGSVLAGSSGGAARFENGNWVPLGLGINSSAAAITPDGTAIVGTVGITSGFLWTQTSGVTSLPFFARDVSANGLVVVGKRPPVAGAGAVGWTAKTGMQVLLAQSGIVDPQADCVSADGNLVGISIGSGGSKIWDPNNGVRDFKQVLLEEGATGVGGWTLLAITDMSPDGLNLVGYGFNPSGQIEAYLAKLPPSDADGDGLFDDWEINGIPYTDSNGVEQRYVLDIDGDGPHAPADPNHKDLFVEIDAMDGPGLAPSLGDLAPVITAFANAPVGNPDGQKGITLHVLIDQTDVPTEDFPNAFVEFDLLKPLYFGTVDEQSDPESVAILDAKRQAYRYCMFANTILNSTISGIGELPGNDFIVNLGGWTTPGGTSQQKAGTFMHELGHTLGLRHGGADDIHYKPNYYSVMNYNWQTPKSWQTPGSWPLSPGRRGYSNFELPALHEGVLIECDGLGATSGQFPALFVVPHNTHDQATAPVVVQSHMTGGINWDDDLMTSCTGDPTVAVDVNHLFDDRVAGDLASPGQVLAGHNDWSALVYDFKNSPDFEDGVHETVQNQPAEMTLELHNALENLLPPFCLGDINLDRTVTVNDLLAVINTWGACGLGCHADIAPPPPNGDSQVNVADLLAVINAWGPCR